MVSGVSIVICCHNSRQRLEPTLAHVAAQRVAAGIPWEVVVVDNDSSDNTGDLARRCWPAPTGAALRVVREDEVGLSKARERGFLESHYPIISFVDDDTWIEPEWINTLVSIMDRMPEVGACGGPVEGVFEEPQPSWFNDYAERYAVGQQAAQSCDVTHIRGYLWGAGLSVRRTAWDNIRTHGFRFRLPGRRPGNLRSGEDVELCRVLALRGWRLWYDTRLQLKHFMPRERLEPGYLKRLCRANGGVSMIMELYSREEEVGIKGWLRSRWYGQFLVGVSTMCRQPGRLFRAIRNSDLTDKDVVWLEEQFGRLGLAGEIRSRFDEAVREIRVFRQSILASHPRTDVAVIV
jgi:GT2 family glycosyltransferase